MNDLELEDWMPMEPDKGPPLPRFLGIYWPWYKPVEPIEGRVIDFAELNILGVDGKAFASVVGTEATLAEPIVVSRMRGVRISWLNKTIAPQPGYGMWWYLRYEPQFTPPMPPPGFALRPGAIPAVGQEAVADITGCWAGGYYYPGIYDGVFSVSKMHGEYYATFERSFTIKSLARVTGEGTVVPPGY